MAKGTIVRGLAICGSGVGACVAANIVKAIRPLTKLFFDVHLMCSQPEILLEPFAKAGADEMIIHVELGEQVPFLIHKIKSLGKKVGLAINPQVAVKKMRQIVNENQPGAGGGESLKSTGESNSPDSFLCIQKMHLPKWSNPK